MYCYWHQILVSTLVDYQASYYRVTICYDPKLSSGYNLDKDLSKDKEDEQLVKCKNTGLYLQLYILNYHEERERCP